MEFSCSVCEYTSNKKENVTRHINRKKTCGQGIREIIEIPIEIICEFCNKHFSCSKNLKYHMINNCKSKLEILEKQLKEANNKIRELEKRPTTITNNITNNTINVFVNDYDKTSLDKLTDKILNNLIKNSDEPYNIIPRMIGEIHFNPDNPENHNIFLSNRNKSNKYVNILKNKQWGITDKDTEIDNIISDKENNLSDWILEKGEQYPNAREKVNDYMEQKHDEDTKKLVKEQILEMLYNNRHMMKIKN